MRVIPPLDITATRLTSSTAPEPGVGEAAYAAGTTYAIGDRVIIGAPSSTVTLTIASPAVVSWTNHGQPAGTPVVLTTTGALPTGLTAGVVYFVLAPATSTFQLSAEPGGAPLVTTGSQSGTHTATTFVHRIFESTVASNTGNYPLLAANVGTKWIDVGPTNRFAMFDLLRSTATTITSPLTVVITPGRRVDSIALVGLVADSVTIEMTSGGGTVYSETIDLSTREVVDWYDYFFAPFSTTPSFALFDLPPYTNGIITVTITRATGMVSCGGLVLGTAVYLGQTQYEAESDALNFSKVIRDDFGDATLVPRRTVPKVNARVMCTKANVNKVRDLRTALNAVPALWSGLDDATDAYFEAVLILGFYRQFGINLAYPEHALISLELEEV